MTEIPGSGSVPPDVKAVYKDDFKKSVDIFQNSLQGYRQADEVHKKGQFKKVMDEALNIMNQTAKTALNDGAQAKKAQLQKDYSDYIDTGTPAAYDKLNRDISSLKKSI